MTTQFNYLNSQMQQDAKNATAQANISPQALKDLLAQQGQAAQSETPPDENPSLFGRIGNFLRKIDERLKHFAKGAWDSLTSKATWGSSVVFLGGILLAGKFGGDGSWAHQMAQFFGMDYQTLTAAGFMKRMVITSMFGATITGTMCAFNPSARNVLTGETCAACKPTPDGQPQVNAAGVGQFLTPGGPGFDNGLKMFPPPVAGRGAQPGVGPG